MCPFRPQSKCSIEYTLASLWLSAGGGPGQVVSLSFAPTLTYWAENLEHRQNAGKQLGDGGPDPWAQAAGDTLADPPPAILRPGEGSDVIRLGSV